MEISEEELEEGCEEGGNVMRGHSEEKELVGGDPKMSV